MPLTTIPAVPKVGWGNANLHKLYDILNEHRTTIVNLRADALLAALKMTVVTGGDGSATVTGIAVDDTLVGVTNLTDLDAVSATISAANTISYTGNLTGKQLQVVYLDKSELQSA